MSVFSWYYSISSNEIDARFSEEDSLAYLDSLFEDDEPDEESQQKITRVRQILKSLPAREADYVDMYFFKKMKQVDIASIFGVSQPTVCYRLQRATSRLQFILSIPTKREADLKKALSGFFSDSLDVNILASMWLYGCQTYTARELRIPQTTVRSRFIRACNRMLGIPTMQEYYPIYSKILANLNILREIHKNTSDIVLFTVN